MSRRSRRNHTAAFKAKVALAALKGEETLLEVALQFDVHANQVTRWKSQLLEGAARIFGGESKGEPAEAGFDSKTLHAKIRQLTLENEFFRGVAQQGRVFERKKMIDREHNLPIKRQAEVLSISRGTAYYKPRPVSERRSSIDAETGRAASELPVHEQSDAASARRRGGSAAHRHTEEEDEHRGDLSQIEHLETRAMIQDISVSAAGSLVDAIQPGVGDRSTRMNRCSTGDSYSASTQGSDKLNHCRTV